MLDPEERHRVIGPHPSQLHRPGRGLLVPAPAPAPDASADAHSEARTGVSAQGTAPGVGRLALRTADADPQLHIRTYPQRIEVLRRCRLRRTGVPQSVGRA
ncbi:hypothetical protein [Streptomyces sp. NPDC056785]|uniref:hypothetical protein n=1 Tax=Streptomyces sp. NPDC056785 TaxID=3345944 RepID=UPI00369CA20D